VETDEEGFRANVWRLNPIYVPQYAYPLADRKLWTVSCQWRTVRLLEDRINCMPFGWTFWPEDRVVSQIEHKFMKEGRESAHLALRHSANL
jgi:hypothetical protein